MNKLLKKEIQYITKRNKVISSLENEVSNYGYLKVEPDIFENYDWFTRNNKRIKPKTMVKLQSPTGDVLLLRPDITTNIIKQVIPFWNEDGVFKLFYNATTFRQTASEIVSSRQFGFEFLGEDSLLAEGEVIEMIVTLFKRFNDNFRLDIGNQQALETLIDDLQLSEEQTSLLKQAIIRKNQNEIDGIIGTNDGPASTLVKQILSLSGSYQAVLAKISTMERTYIDSLMGPINSIMEMLPNAYQRIITIDLSLLSQYDYYSGIIFQGYLTKTPEPILFGGRYNKLTEQFGRSIPAIGASFDANAYIKEVPNE